MRRDVSVVLVSFNNLPYLKEAIGSVLMQTRPPEEVIIADDGSTDGSRELIAGFAAASDRIRVILRERNLGVAPNRDLAIREARGSLVSTLDGDDYYLPGKLERELDALERFGARVACSDWILTDSSGCERGRRQVGDFCVRNAPDMVRHLAFLRGNRPRDMLVERSLYEEVGGMRHTLKRYEDLDYKLRLVASSGPWAHVPEPGLAHRITGTGLSTATTLVHIAAQERVLKDRRGDLVRQLGRPTYWGARLAVYVRASRQLVRSVVGRP